jgi:hypothetical protein
MLTQSSVASGANDEKKIIILEGSRPRLSEGSRPDPCHRASGRSHRGGRGLGVPVLKPSSLVARRILTYRHQLVASPGYLKACKRPKAPKDLLDHRSLTFSHCKPETSWTFVHKNGIDKETLTFRPHFSMNDYSGLAPALAAGAGIGELPPVVQSMLIREAIWSKSCPAGGSAPTASRLSTSETATSPSRTGSSRITQCKWRQVCFRSCRSERSQTVPIQQRQFRPLHPQPRSNVRVGSTPAVHRRAQRTID